MHFLPQLLAITLWCWLGLSMVSLLSFNHYFQKLLRFASVIGSMLILLLGSMALFNTASVTLTIPLFLPQWPMLLHIDALSAFFILLMGASLVGITCFSINYLNHFSTRQQCVIQSLMSLFVLAMLMVFTADNILTFLFSWEMMALSSYFLVVSVEPSRINQKAGFLYLSIAHVGLFAIAASFFLLALPHGSLAMSFATLATLPHSILMANSIFILALLGFGAKAGLFPLHIWLPEAHPAAPSSISALMSGVMLKTAIYGLLKFIFVFLAHQQQDWWGYTLITIGLITMLIGVIHAAMQTDVKRLLAYSSMENIGFIATSLGLTILFDQHHLIVLANLALLVALLHCLNHSLFKSLLFLGTGSILHATGSRNLGKLGGLIKKMPWVSAFMLVGTLSMAGLPLFSGFISEWLYLNIFFSYHLPMHFVLGILSPIIIALSVLVFGLAGFVVIKFFGIAFLGQPREAQLTQASSATIIERIGLGWLAFLCLLLGIWPNTAIHLIQTINTYLIPSTQPAVSTMWGLSLHPQQAHASFNPLLLGVSLIILFSLLFFILKIVSRQPLRKAPLWSCGYRHITPRMQDSAEGFGQPFKQIFSALIDLKLSLPSPDAQNPYYQSRLTEKIWRLFYYPLVFIATRIAALTSYVQQGKISHYLLFMGITLILLLSWVVWS